MTFNEAFRYILNTKDIERVANSEYLYEIEGEGTYTEEQVIEYAEKLQQEEQTR